MEPSLLEIGLHWPHDRFAIGWDIMQPDDEYDYFTLRLYLGIMTITFNNV